MERGIVEVEYIKIETPQDAVILFDHGFKEFKLIKRDGGIILDNGVYTMSFPFRIVFLDNQWTPYTDAAFCNVFGRKGTVYPEVMEG